MPEDVIARAIAEQASRSPQELGQMVPGVLVGLGEQGLLVASEVVRLLEGSHCAAGALAALRRVVIAPPGLGAPADPRLEVVTIEPEWRPDQVRLRHVDEWLSPELARSRPESFKIRQVERLAFFSAYAGIRARLQAARDQAAEAGRKAAGFNFYVVAGLGEGGGSGLVFDVAHLARQLLEEVPEGRVVGYLLLPAADAGMLARPNAFAALKELDYFNAGGELAVRYAAGAPAETLASPLFSACYLLDGSKPGGDRQGEVPPAEQVALHIHADFLTGGVGASNRAIRERLGRVARPGREDKAGCQVAYRTLGASRIHVDNARLARACGLAVADRLLARILEAPHDDAEARLARFCAAWDPADPQGGLMSRLVAADPAGPLTDQVAEWTRDLADRLAREADPRTVRTWLEGRLDELASRLDPETGELRPLIGLAASRAATALEAELDAELADIGKAARTAGWFSLGRRFLEGLAARLRRHFEQVEDARLDEERVAQSCERLLETHLDEIQRAYAHPLARFAATRKAVTEGATATLWRTLDELLAVRLRLAAWSAVPGFLEDAGRIVASRAEALSEAAAALIEARTRVLAAHEQVLASGPLPGELYDPAWIEADVGAILAAQDDVLARLASRLLERCGAASPLDLHHEDLDMRLATALRDVADEAAALVPPRSAADRLRALARSEADQRRALETALGAAAVRLDLGCSDGAELPGPEGRSLLVGIPGGPANPRGDFAPLLDLLLLGIDDLAPGVQVSVADLPGHADQLLFISEVAGFPLRSLGALDDLAARYREWLRQPKADPVHMAKDPGAFETIPGIFPPDERSKRRALEAFVIGVQWGFFELENGIVIHRQKLPGMTFLDTRIVGTLDRPLRAVKYLVDHPELTALAHARISEMVQEAQADPDVRRDRLARLERYYLRVLEECRSIVTGPDLIPEDDAESRDEVIRHLPLWELAEAVLAFNSRHGFDAAHVAPEPGTEAAPEAESLPGPDTQLDPPAVLAPAAGSDERLCPRCGTLSPARAKFCAECALPLQRPDACPACGSAAPAGARFCIECAAPLAEVRWEASRP